MDAAFYISSAVALAATLLAITRHNTVHALLYFIVSLLAVALLFFVLGAHFAAALQVIVYAGAIAVLFVFVVMMLNLGEVAADQERRWLRPGIWTGPTILAALLLALLAYLLVAGRGEITGLTAVDPKQVGLVFLGPYLLAVELASMLLLAGLIGTYHLGRRGKEERA